jgi:radical SAM protein with 4Fe4S-binding SPASM domain
MASQSKISALTAHRASGVGVDANALAKLKRIASGVAAARRFETSELPEEISFKLTQRCDMRCTHCYQWGEGGYHLQEPKGELAFEIIEKVMAATQARGANVFLWGGEPLLYRQWERLASLLTEQQRWVSVCTNGSLIERRLPSLLSIGAKLEISVSIDGFADQHDALRGPGAFAKTLAGIQALRANQFQGELSINAVVSAELLPRLSEFVDLVESWGVGTLYISLPWFLSKSATQKMDAFAEQNLPWLKKRIRPSWYSYSYALNADRADEFRLQAREIAGRQGPLKVRYNPELADSEIAEFLQGSDTPSQGKTACGAIHARMDVFPDGSVVSCKFFPEFVMGNLSDSALHDVWHGERFKTLRDTHQQCGLMPVCAKCNLLYTRGA